jgi:hypothetical protein
MSKAKNVLSALISAVDAAPVAAPKAPKAPKAPIAAKADKAAELPSAFTFSKYDPKVKALVKEIGIAANAATSAGLKVATSLADAFMFEPWKATGHRDAGTWALALLAEACPLSAVSTRYAWIEAGMARSALLADPAMAKVIDSFPMDALRIVGAKSNTGHNAAKMVALATELMNDPKAKNAKGSIDPQKAAKIVRGVDPSTPPTRDEMLAALCGMARKYCPNDATAAYELLKAATDRAKVFADGVVLPA